MRIRKHMTKTVLMLTLALLGVEAAPAGGTEAGPYQVPGPPGRIALTHANVVDVRSGDILPDATVLLREGVIFEVGAAGVPDGYEEMVQDYYKALAGEIRDQ